MSNLRLRVAGNSRVAKVDPKVFTLLTIGGIAQRMKSQPRPLKFLDDLPTSSLHQGTGPLWRALRTARDVGTSRANLCLGPARFGSLGMRPDYG